MSLFLCTKIGDIPIFAMIEKRKAKILEGKND